MPGEEGVLDRRPILVQFRSGRYFLLDGRHRIVAKRVQNGLSTPATVIRVADADVLERFEDVIRSEPGRSGERALTSPEQVAADFLEWVGQHGDPLPSASTAPPAGSEQAPHETEAIEGAVRSVEETKDDE